MREYSYQATEASVEALRRLREPWVSVVASEREVLVTTADAFVLVTAEAATVEETLDATRLRADLLGVDDAHLPGAGELPVGSLGRGRNDVVLFNGESWTVDHGAADGAAAGRTMQFTGRAGQRPDEAVIVCTTTDALVVAASDGEGLLIRLGVRPLALEIERDRVAIARFLVQRGYGNEEDPR